MIIKIITVLAGIVLGYLIVCWLFFLADNKYTSSGNTVKLPFSTVRFLLLKEPSDAARVEYDSTAIRILLYKKSPLKQFAQYWEYHKTVYVTLSFFDWLKYRSFYRQLKKGKTNRLEYENLQRVRDIIKAEQERLEQAAERERKKALDILQGMAADKNDRQHETAKRLTGIKRPSGVFNKAIATALQRGALTPDEARAMVFEITIKEQE